MIHPATAVYVKNHCQPCRRTKAELTLRGVEFTEVNIETEPDALAYVKSLGYQAAPVVVLGSGAHWSGMRPDLIKEHFGPRAAA